MWTKGSKRRNRSKKPPKGVGWRPGLGRQGAYQVRQAAQQPKRGSDRAGSSLWRRLRWQLRRMWRWGVVPLLRRVTGGFRGSVPVPTGEREPGEVKKFPTSR